jgi:hypothetical protein
MLALNAETVETLRFETPARTDKLGLRRRVLAGRIWRFANIVLTFTQVAGRGRKVVDAGGWCCRLVAITCCQDPLVRRVHRTSEWC